MQSKTALEADAAATQKRMDSANALLSALAGEEGRWTQQSQAFDTTIQCLTGAAILKWCPSGNVITLQKKWARDAKPFHVA